ncbi:helix-hairpin-helix domain-containing protein [Phytohabitans rumicis]|nr:helix-hairpin-helix domain-containing protein [Phytohabitans rumicis]
MESDLRSLVNIGPKLAADLRQVGVRWTTSPR